ncbi:hypothetical protein ADL25_07675 [Streptomyces sp. NRRL F-5122]|nr:hypothetical protein ADL25_07675 [Streptomyces sp. NRRL F-5122]
MSTMGSTAFCLLLQEMNLFQSLRPTAGRCTGISLSSVIPVLPMAPKWSRPFAGVRNRTPGATVQSRSAKTGSTSVMAGVIATVRRMRMLRRRAAQRRRTA